MSADLKRGRWIVRPHGNDRKTPMISQPASADCRVQNAHSIPSRAEPHAVNHSPGAYDMSNSHHSTFRAGSRLVSIIIVLSLLISILAPLSIVTIRVQAQSQGIVFDRAASSASSVKPSQ